MLRATGLLLVGLCLPRTVEGVATLIDAINGSLWPFVTPGGLLKDPVSAVFYWMNWRDTSRFLVDYGTPIAGFLAGAHMVTGGTFRLVGVIAKETGHD